MRRISLESFHRATYPPCIFAVPSFPAPGKGLGITPRPKLGFHEAARDQLRPNLPEEIRMKAIRLTLLFALALGVAQLVPRDASAKTNPYPCCEIQSSLGDPDGNTGGLSFGKKLGDPETPRGGIVKRVAPGPWSMVHVPVGSSCVPSWFPRPLYALFTQFRRSAGQ